MERRVLVTGAGSGIGRAIALRLAREGARLILVGRTRDPLEATAEACVAAGGAADAFVADVGSEAGVARLATHVDGVLGALDGLVNNAGIPGHGTLDSTDPAEWDLVLRVNATGPFLVSRACLDLLRRGRDAAIVNVASTLGLLGLKNAVAYCASKGALVNMTRAAALDLAPEGIRCNAVCPAVVDTGMPRVDRGDGLDADARLAELGALHPLGRVARPHEIADVVAWLLSAESAFLTGAAIPVDGGMTAGFTR